MLDLLLLFLQFLLPLHYIFSMIYMTGSFQVPFIIKNVKILHNFELTCSIC